MRVSRGMRLSLRTVALGYLLLLLALPVGFVFYKTFDKGLGAVWDALTSDNAISAIKLTLLMVAVAVPLNTAFGVLAALVIVRGRMRGKALLNALIDLPFAISPCSTAARAGSAPGCSTTGSRSSSRPRG